MQVSPKVTADGVPRPSARLPVGVFSPGQHVVAPWRDQAFGILRILFGIAWAIDAQFKWQPAFQSGFASYLTGALDGQPALVKAWIGFWINIINVNPHVFGMVVALSESALAVALIFGVFSNLATLGGVLLTLVIWSTAEGFGGPYKAGSTDIGTAIIYAFVFVALFLAQSGLQFGLDRRLTPILGRWGWLASGPFKAA
jgi:uncharacterized membrane protein YphA (DoxX/SURF4 family)